MTEREEAEGLLRGHLYATGYRLVVTPAVAARLTAEGVSSDLFDVSQRVSST